MSHHLCVLSARGHVPLRGGVGWDGTTAQVRVRGGRGQELIQDGRAWDIGGECIRTEICQHTRALSLNDALSLARLHGRAVSLFFLSCSVSVSVGLSFSWCSCVFVCVRVCSCVFVCARVYSCVLVCVTPGGTPGCILRHSQGLSHTTIDALLQTWLSSTGEIVFLLVFNLQCQRQSPGVHHVTYPRLNIRLSVTTYV